MKTCMKTSTRVILAIIGFILLQVGLITGWIAQNACHTMQFDLTPKGWICALGLLVRLIFGITGVYLIVAAITGEFLKP